MTKPLFRLLLALTCLPASAGTLSGHLNQLEMNHIVEILGIGSASRLMRSAEAYDLWPGAKLGVEITLLPTRDINEVGDRTGSVPGFNPGPRLYLAKGLPLDLEVILNYWSVTVVNTVSTAGIMLKWTFKSEQDSWASGAVYGGFTHISAYDDAYYGNDEELGVEFSKDYVRLKPYVGMGFLLAQGTFGRYLAATQYNNATAAVFHAFTGLEIEMPANVTLQLDLMNLSLTASLAITKHFD
jgi:hypothetical protein